jgi:hypothetical protein
VSFSFYILQGKTPVPCQDTLDWAIFMETGDRTVVKTMISEGVVVSTVFLGIDHSFGSNDPILYETMVFGGEHTALQRRYQLWEEAELGHDEIVALLRSWYSTE